MANADLIVGGQGVYVQLTSSNSAYNSVSGQFTVDVAVQNLIEQPLGTDDGVSPDAAGCGCSSRRAQRPPRAAAPFWWCRMVSTASRGRARRTTQYDTVLGQGQVSAARTWTLVMPPTVSTFAFSVYVAAAVQWPDGEDLV